MLYSTVIYRVNYTSLFDEKSSNERSSSWAVLSLARVTMVAIRQCSAPGNGEHSSIGTCQYPSTTPARLQEHPEHSVLPSRLGYHLYKMFFDRSKLPLKYGNRILLPQIAVKFDVRIGSTARKYEIGVSHTILGQGGNSPNSPGHHLAMTCSDSRKKAETTDQIGSTTPQNTILTAFRVY